MTVELAFRASGALVAIALLLTSTELWASRHDYERGGIFERSWNTPGTSPSSLPLVRFTAVVQMLSATAMLVPTSPVPLVGLAALVAMTCTGLWMRAAPTAADGADGMAQVILAALALGALGGTRVTLQAAVLFISFQASLAYGVAGVSKLASIDWRRGSALPAILAIEPLGSPLWRLIFRGHPWRALAASWGVIAWEAAFPVALFVPDWVLFPWLAVGVVFHIGCALALGLNRFVPVFLATYPALVFANGWIRTNLGW